MTPDAARVAEIARGLTKAQRKPVVHAVPRGRNIVTGEPAYFEAWARTNTLRSMGKMGLIDRQILTPLGLAVRTYLTENPHV